MTEPEEWIRQLGLIRHPEGGWYRESYRSGDTILSRVLPPGVEGERACSTAIYFLLCSDDFSALHRIASDELWHFYSGDPLTIQVITTDGVHQRLLLGPDFAKEERFQQLVPRGAWFGAEIEPPGAYTLVGCTVAPGFDFRDFQLGSQADLLAGYPAHGELIRRLTR